MAVLPYENTGTATVVAGSVDVVGQGTRWLQCRPSDTFFGRAGERNIVESIADDTHLKLVFPATIDQAAQGVAVMRTPDDVFTQTTARQVFQKISDSILVALAGMPVANRKGFRLGALGAAETFDLSDKGVELLGKADETAMRTILNVAAKQANASDGTVGAGLIVGAFGLGGVTAHQPAGANINTLDRTQFLNTQDGTPTGWDAALGSYPIGFNVQRSTQVKAQFAMAYGGNAAFRTAIDETNWLPWRRLFHSHNALGTVSQSGGIPTGALMESGSNANGQYRRYADGWQTCTHKITVANVSEVNGYIYASPLGATWTQPAAFSEIPSCHGEDANSENIWVQARGSGNTSVTFRAYCFGSVSGTRTITLRSFGRWY